MTAKAYRQTDVWEFLRANPKSTYRDVVKGCEVSASSARQALVRLANSGYAEFEGSGKVRWYYAIGITPPAVMLGGMPKGPRAPRQRASPREHMFSELERCWGLA